MQFRPLIITVVATADGPAPGAHGSYCFTLDRVTVVPRKTPPSHALSKTIAPP